MFVTKGKRRAGKHLVCFKSTPSAGRTKRFKLGQWQFRRQQRTYREIQPTGARTGLAVFAHGPYFGDIVGMWIQASNREMRRRGVTQKLAVEINLIACIEI